MGDKIGWMVCVACIVSNFIRAGIVLSFGAFIAEFRQLYQNPMAELDWIGVMTPCVTGVLSPLAAFIIHKNGKKGYAICSFIGTLVMSGGCFASSLVDHVSWLYLTFSIISGLGSSLQFLPSLLIVHEFFPSDHRFHVLATTSYQYAFPSGVMVFSPLFTWIIQITSWRDAFVIAGVMMLIFGTTSSLAFLLNKTLPEYPETQTNKANEELESKSDIEEQSHANNYMDSNWRDICRTPKRFCWLFGILMTFAIQMVTVFNLTHYMESKNYKKLESTVPLVLLSFVQILALFVLSSIGRCMKGRLICCNIISCLLLASVFIVWSFVDPSYKVILVFSSVIGVSSTLSFGYMNPSSVENMSMKVNISWTASCVSAGIGTLLSPLLSGAIYDFRQSYSDVFLAVGIAAFFTGLIFIVIPVLDACKLTQNNYETLK